MEGTSSSKQKNMVRNRSINHRKKQIDKPPKEGEIKEEREMVAEVAGLSVSYKEII